MTGDTARLFVSLELPDTIRRALSDWALGTEVKQLGLRLLAPEALHLTLCFLGSQPVGEIEAIGDACAGALRGSGSGSRLALTLGGARWLPPRRPRVLAVDLADSGEALGPLQTALAERLARGGWYEPERRNYLPHVTVGRAGRSGLDRGARPDAVPPPDPLAFTADTVALMRSHLGPGGSRYETLAQVRLGEESSTV